MKLLCKVLLLVILGLLPAVQSWSPCDGGPTLYSHDGTPQCLQ